MSRTKFKAQSNIVNVDLSQSMGFIGKKPSKSTNCSLPGSVFELFI